MLLDTIKLIEGKQLQRIGRSIDVIWLWIGEIRESVIGKKKRLHGAYGINITCVCRFISANNEILFTSDDKFCPKPGSAYDQSFDWDVQGENAYDYKAKIWFSSNSPIYISNVERSELGDLKIVFSNGDLLETFSSYSKDELWRFFEPGVDKPHLVASAGKVEYQ